MLGSFPRAWGGSNDAARVHRPARRRAGGIAVVGTMLRRDPRAGMRRREFIGLAGGAITAWPIIAGAQSPAMPVIGFMNLRPARPFIGAPLPPGLRETRYIQGPNLTTQNPLADGHGAPLPPFVADLGGRRG